MHSRGDYRLKRIKYAVAEALGWTGSRLEKHVLPFLWDCCYHDAPDAHVYEWFALLPLRTIIKIRLCGRIYDLVQKISEFLLQKYSDMTW